MSSTRPESRLSEFSGAPFIAPLELASLEQMLNYAGIGRRRLPDFLRKFPMDRSAYEGANAAAAAPMLKAFVAGLFYLRIGRGEVVCVPWPSLWIVGSRRRSGTCVPDR